MGSKQKQIAEEKSALSRSWWRCVFAVGLLQGFDSTVVWGVVRRHSASNPNPNKLGALGALARRLVALARGAQAAARCTGGHAAIGARRWDEG